MVLSSKLAHSESVHGTMVFFPVLADAGCIPFCIGRFISDGIFASMLAKSDVVCLLLANSHSSQYWLILITFK